MSIGILGVDSSSAITEGLVLNATTGLGVLPKYWGRYFKSVATVGGVQYSQNEADVFRSHDLHLLPFGRQTNLVGGTEAVGAMHGKKNIEAFFHEIALARLTAQSDKFYFFLDVEPSHPMSKEYYVGWSRAVIETGKELSHDRILMAPGVYLNHGDAPTANHLRQAMEDSGAVCHGLAVASYGARTTLQAPQWSDASTSTAAHVPAPVLIWQFVGDVGPGQALDGDEMNPTFPDVFKHLVIP